MNIFHVWEYMERWAKEDPRKTAVIDQSGAVTYAELVSAYQSVASDLARRIEQGSPIAVCMDKGIPALCSFFGIASAGGFYVLLNPDLPPARLSQIQSLLQAPYVITDEAHASLALRLFAPEQVLLIEDLRKAPVDSGLLASVRANALDTDPLYANFTSGSTGVPKGVVVSHRSVIDFIEHFSEVFAFSRDDRFANQAPFDFDVSVKDIYTAMKIGATLVITPKALFSRPAQLLDWLCEQEVTVMVWAVSALCLISTLHGLDYKTPKTVRKILFSGEVMPLKHLDSWRSHLPDAMFVNLYGPTEITCNCTYHILSPERGYEEGVPIGRSFPNEQILLLDQDNKRITEPGTEGEICVRGSALALGYLCAPEQTAAAFVQNPCNTRYPELIYRTGDLGKYDEAGELLFCGRRDHQIKYMGHRIELQEVEHGIAGVEGVERCCCVFDGEKQKLYGFYQGTIDKAELQKALGVFLPAFMIPGVLDRVDEFPLTKNGKIDRGALLQRRRKRR